MIRSTRLLGLMLSLQAAFVTSGCSLWRLGPPPQPPAPSPKPAPSVEPTPRPFILPAPSRLRFQSGLTAWTVRRTHQPLVTVRLVVRAGSRHDEAALPGQAKITAAMLRRGAGNRDAQAFEAAIDGTGGRFDISVEPDATILSATVLRRDLDLVLALMSEAVQDPWMLTRDLVEVCRDRLDELEALQDDGDGLADALVRQAVLRGHPYGRLPSRRAVEALLARDVRRFHRTWYRPERAQVVVVGDVTPAEVRRLLIQRFASWRGQGRRPTEPARRPPPPLPRRPAIWVMDLDATQSYIRLGAPVPPRNRLPEPGVDALNFVLGGDFTSRLNLELRDRQGLAYGAYSRFDSWREAGMFSARVNTRTESTRRTVDRLLSVVRGLRRVPVTRAEAETARMYLSGSFPMRFETNATLAGEFSDLALYGLPEESVAGYREALTDVVPASLYRLAREHLPDRSYHLVVVGNARRVVPALKGLGEVRVVRKGDLFR